MSVCVVVGFFLDDHVSETDNTERMESMKSEYMPCVFIFKCFA